MELAGRRVVVTGGAGFIGSHVVDHLARTGASVVAFDDLSVGRAENLRGAVRLGAELVVGDVRDREQVRAVLDGAAAVIHMACDNLRASLGNPRHTHEVNSTGTLETALAAVDAGVERFVYVSSSEAYGTARISPMAEDHPLEPTTVYGASKAAGELYVRGCMTTYGLPSVIVRPFNSYGPREHATGTSGEVIPRFVQRILAGEPPVIFGDGSQTRDFTWVEETAVGIVAAASCDGLVGEAVNVAFGTPVTIRKVADLLLEVMAAPGLRPDAAEPRPGDVMHHWADVAKAERLMGYRARVGIAEGLERYVRWVQSPEAEEPGAEVEPVRNW